MLSTSFAMAGLKTTRTALNVTILVISSLQFVLKIYIQNYQFFTQLKFIRIVNTGALGPECAELWPNLTCNPFWPRTKTRGNVPWVPFQTVLYKAWLSIDCEVHIHRIMRTVSVLSWKQSSEFTHWNIYTAFILRSRKRRLFLKKENRASPKSPTGLFSKLDAMNC